MPHAMWMPALFNPTAFLTAIKQNHCRKQNPPLPLDEMITETFCTTMWNVEDCISYPPNGGCYCHGLYIEGGRWTDAEESMEFAEEVDGESTAGILVESRLKELLPQMPIILFKSGA